MYSEITEVWNYCYLMNLSNSVHVEIHLRDLQQEKTGDNYFTSHMWSHSEIPLYTASMKIKMKLTSIIVIDTTYTVSYLIKTITKKVKLNYKCQSVLQERFYFCMVCSTVSTLYVFTIICTANKIQIPYICLLCFIIIFIYSLFSFLNIRSKLETWQNIFPFNAITTL